MNNKFGDDINTRQKIIDFQQETEMGSGGL